MNLGRVDRSTELQMHGVKMHCYAKGKSGCYLQKGTQTLGQQKQFLSTIAPKQLFLSQDVIKTIDGLLYLLKIYIYLSLTGHINK